VLLLSKAVGNAVPFFCTGTGPTIPPGTTINSNVVTNQIWGNDGQTCCDCDASNTYFVDGTIFVNPGVTLTVKPGTCIKETKQPGPGDPPSVLVVQPGAQIPADGQPDCRILFTSDQPAGSRQKGDHGGLVLNGNAPVNCPGGTCQAEGLSNVPFGGSKPND